MSLSIRGLVIIFVVPGLVLVSGQAVQSQTGAKRAPPQKQVKLSVVDGVKVRTRLLPMAFDEKGAPRKLTTEEVKELRGNDPKLPGYAADYSDLKGGQAVLIYLGRIKTTIPIDDSQSGNEAAKSTSQPWDPAGQFAARLVKVEGPEFAKSKTTPKGKAGNKTISRQITVSVTATAVPALQDLSAVLIEILDDRTTK